MIRVTVKKLTQRKKNDFGESIIVAAANSVADQMATLLKKKIKDIKCDNHNPSRMTIVVSANAKKFVSLKKTNPCCKEFSDKVRLDNLK